MRINENMINQLPILLKRLSNGESLNIPFLHKTLDIPIRTLQSNFEKVLVPLFPHDIKYDNSTKNWYSEKNFLLETLLSAEELVTMKLLDNYSEGLGKRFSLSTKRLFNRFKRRASLKIFKKAKMEKILKEDEAILALIENSITSKRVLKCIYNNKNREVHPLKIVLLEGYWYLYLWDVKDKIIKKFHLKSMSSLILTDKIFESPKTEILNKLDGAINAYFKDAPTIDVELLVHNKVVKYFQRQPLSKYQKITLDNDPNYKLMTLPITDEMEIIPTIQQYLPYIKVISPESLHLKIQENISNYINPNLSE